MLRIPLKLALIASTLATGGLVLPAAGETNSGPYLAAQVAASDANYEAAARWFGAAREEGTPNQTILEGLVIANIGLGDFAAAAVSAAELDKMGAQSQPAVIALVTEQTRSGDYAAIAERFAKGPQIGALVDGLIAAWAEVGNGRMSEALAGFDRLAATKGLEAFGLYHKALALAQAGDFEGAEAILSGRASGSLSLLRRGVIAYAEILSQLERNADAITVLQQSFGAVQDPEIDAMRTRLAAGETLAFDAIRSPADGMAEVFFTLAVALDDEAEAGYTLLYARAAAALRPDHVDAILMVAALLEREGQHALASKAYAMIRPEDPSYFVAEIGRAGATQASGSPDASIEILQALARTHGDVVTVQVALGDALRRQERFVDAIKAYDTALGLIETVVPAHWQIFYARAISHERQAEFDLAVKDFTRALELAPNQPQVLNYLGYSYVERGENLEEALGMIKRAVAAEPKSGYIIDSLAWAYFRLGRYEEALLPMERASLLEPVDPVVTDHLGDVYWAVGRKREAEFQWHRALSFAPSEKDAARIRLKLELGLDAVLAQEGAAPLQPVQATDATPTDAD